MKQNIHYCLFRGPKQFCHLKRQKQHIFFCTVWHAKYFPLATVTINTIDIWSCEFFKVLTHVCSSKATLQDCGVVAFINIKNPQLKKGVRKKQNKKSKAKIANHLYSWNCKSKPKWSHNWKTSIVRDATLVVFVPSHFYISFVTEAFTTTTKYGYLESLKSCQHKMLMKFRNLFIQTCFWPASSLLHSLYHILQVALHGSHGGCMNGPGTHLLGHTRHSLKKKKKNLFLTTLKFCIILRGMKPFVLTVTVKEKL